MPDQSPMIAIHQLKKTYLSHGQEVTALQEINLEIPRGDIFGIIGMSGAGKSTLIRCMNLLERPTAGQIIIDGQDMTRLSDKELRQMRLSVGMIFQRFNLLMQSTVEKNVLFPLEITHTPKKEAKKRAMELLNLVGLGDKAGAYPAQLSGGQMQRVAIARALAANPKVLLCDEATSALDPMTTTAILDLLKNINKQLGITIVVITHEMNVIRRICNQVAIIDQGVIAEQGAVGEIFTNPRTDAAKRLFRPNKPETSGSKRALRLIFAGQAIYEPVISGMIQACGVPVSIISADIEQMGDGIYGQTTIEIPEDQGAASRILDYLAEQGVTTEEVTTE